MAHLHRCLWLTPPAPGAEDASVQGPGGVSRRSQWPDGSLSVYLQRASPLECHCCQQTTANGSGSQWCAAQGCNCCPPNSTFYTSPTSSSHKYHWGFWLCCCSNQPADQRCHGMIAAVFLHCPSLHYSAEHTKETAAICTLGALPAAEQSEDPPGLKRQILSPQLQLWSSHQQSQSWCRHLCRCPF